MLKEKNIEEFLTKKGWNFSNNKSIVGVIMPSKIDLFFGTGVYLQQNILLYILEKTE